jgi:asparagine synthase (glutamine-hydrolysing)
MEFLILPDCQVAGAIATAAGGGPQPESAAARTFTHHSGRPWLVGQWHDDEVALVIAGTRRLAVFGRTSFDRATVERRLADAGSVAALDGLARDVPGAVHVVASIDGQTRAQGSLSTARQIFHAAFAGVRIGASDASRLTALIGAHPDDDALALRLLSPIAPWPLLLHPIWTGVAQLAVGCWLELANDGAHREVPWWTPPAPDVPLQLVAPLLRDALSEAVAARVPADGRVSADLSGGLDSTSLCFLADTAGADLTTQHWQPVDRANDDTGWARRAADLLTRARHRFVDPASAPSWFDPDLHDEDGRRDPEGPLNWTRNRAHLEHQANILNDEGIRLHLIGVGGDELFGLQSAYLWSLVRRQPMRSLPIVRRAQLVNRWSLRSTATGLLDRTSFAGSLAAMADGIEHPRPPRPGQAPQRWGSDAQLPPWASRAAVDTVVRQLRSAAGTGTAPLDPDRLQHQMLQSVLRSGVAIRQLNSALGYLGVSWEAPMLDDRILELALSVRVEERVQRGRYKPVLTAALRGVVPDPILERRTKGEFSAEMYEGRQRNLRALLELVDDLELARLGLVDAAVLRGELLKPYPEPRHLKVFEATLAYETWLRSPSAAGPRTTLPVGELR